MRKLVYVCWLALCAGCYGSDAPRPRSVFDGGVAEDAAIPDGAVAVSDAAPDMDAAVEVCACGPESCEARVCGRSQCGYPCGTCGDAQYCHAGGACRPGGGPGTPCSDAFDAYGWGNVWEGDVGLRVCPTDASQVEACTCAGGGPDAWIDCSGTCFAPCAGEVRCGDVTCGPLEYCQGCSDGTSPATYTCRPRSESEGTCGVGAFLVLDVFCDGDDDCADGDQCMYVAGDFATLRCERGDRDGCGVYHELCGESSECPDCASSCVPATFADLTTPANYGVSVCR